MLHDRRRDKWTVDIRAGANHYRSRRFDTKAEAVAHRNEKMIELHGEFARFD